MPTKPKPIPRERKSGKDFKIGEAPSGFKKGLTTKRKRKKTFKEANADLKKRQEGLKTRNMIRDAMGRKLDNPNTRVEIDGKEAKGLKKGGKVGGTV